MDEKDEKWAGIGSMTSHFDNTKPFLNQSHLPLLTLTRSEVVYRNDFVLPTRPLSQPADSFVVPSIRTANRIAHVPAALLAVGRANTFGIAFLDGTLLALTTVYVFASFCGRKGLFITFYH